jgi:hypothetical protein
MRVLEWIADGVRGRAPKAFTSVGVTSSRLETISCDKERAMCSESNEAGWLKNLVAFQRSRTARLSDFGPEIMMTACCSSRVAEWCARRK